MYLVVDDQVIKVDVHGGNDMSRFPFWNIELLSSFRGYVLLCYGFVNSLNTHEKEKSL